MLRRANKGYTLLEVIVALVVFTTGALGLAAGSAIVTREMGVNGIRAAAARLASNRQERVASACRTAQSGSETSGSVRSVWTISRPDSARLRLAGTISYPTRRGIRTEPYALAVWCG
ncbi:MAG: prepilin-type N-terminal cleavage/methylation domain-containing protein [Gemmatimonadota bacterium]|nr:prepilin-type N-terminal cleavage/methylation domain-containing protein [Gemmatimonadota bacterium]